MISFFRRALSSWIVLGLLGLVMVAFIVTGIGTPGGLDQISGGSANAVARIGGEDLGANEAAQRIQLTQQNLAETQPGLTLESFVAQGGADEVIRQLIEARTLEAWAGEIGVVASKRLIDGQIASIPAFRGPTGSFDEATFRAAIAQRQITEAQLRRDIGSDLVRRQLLAPSAGLMRAPSGLALPYTALLLERRIGSVASVPASLFTAGPAPSEAEVKGWYQKNIARYSLPERRVMRYALIEQIKPEAATPSEAEIAAAYRADAAKYAARETRSFSQLILPTEAAAKALHAKIKAGTPFADAAKAAGFTAADTTLGAQTKAQLSALAGAQLAASAFAAPQGATLAPAKSALGWHVVRVDRVETIPAVPLATARAEIAARLGKQKADAALADLIAAIEEQVAEGASFDEVAKARGLTVVTSPALTAQGLVVDAAAPVPDPITGALVRTAFEVSTDDDPTVETIGDGAFHVLFKLAEVIPAAPRPFAEVRAEAGADFAADRARARARAVAEAVKAKAEKGMPLARAVAEAGVALPGPMPAPMPVDARQIDIARSGRAAPAPVMALFRMKPGQLRLVPAPGNDGWLLVRLDRVIKANAVDAPDLVAATRAELNGQMSQELSQQLTAAAAKAVGVKRNEAAIARLKAQLRGSAQ